MTDRMRTVRRSWIGLAAIIVCGAVMVGAAGCKRGARGPAGPAAAPAVTPEVEGPTSGLVGTIAVSTPSGGGGTYFDTGERITFTVTLKDDAGHPVDINSTNLDRDRFHIYGPLDQSKTVACQNLMNVTSPGSYIHLVGPHTGLTVSGNVATFVSGAIAAEGAGTYRAVAWLTSKTETYDRCFVVKEFQIKTATVETETVALTQCAACHKGADNGHPYFAHSDPSAFSATGVYELDNQPVASCKTCHNQSGYSNTTDSWVSARTRTPDPIIRRVHGIHMGEELKSPRNTHRMAITGAAPTVAGGFNPTDAEDPTTTPVRLIHGLTSGAEARVISSDGSTYFALGHVTGEFEIGETMDVLKITDLTRTAYNLIKATNTIGTAVVAASTTYNANGTTSSVAVAEGYFADYTTVVFPADVRNCTACHIDNKWKEKPSKYACGACHDNIWWGDENDTPEGFEDHPGGRIANIANGVEGAEHDVSLCNPCHVDSLFPIADSHEVPRFVAIDQHTPATQAHTVELALDPPPPAAGYSAGDAPKVLVTVKDAAGTKVDPATITEAAWSGLTLLVAGPRSGHSTPVLTTAARGMQVSVTNGTAGPWSLSGSPTFILAVNGAAPITLTAAPENFGSPAAATAAEVVTWLNSEAAFSSVAGAIAGTGTSAGKVTIKSKLGLAGSSKLEILASGVATAMGWTVRITYPTGSTTTNDLRIRTASWDADARVTRNSTDMRIEYQLDDVTGLTAGTYTIYVNGYKTARPEGFALLTFEVGTATADRYIAKNCGDCHGITLMHRDAGGRHPVEFNTDYCKNCHDYRREANSSDVWVAYGADPIVKKVHGVHRGHYLTYPDKIYPNNPVWSGIIFPQDIRNCTKCHSSDTTGTWNTNPSRLACGSCHDSDSAERHMSLETMDPTPDYDSTTLSGGAWSGDEVETCVVCHGEDRPFEATKVHNISNPYVPPYAR